MRKLLVICGPTATGKTALGISLAKKFSGEIISADSRQVYRGMDIATGKDVTGGVWRTVRRGKERNSDGWWEIEEVPIHLLDVVNPNQEFSVSHYYRLAWEGIRDIWQRKKLPILVGGTGFYIKAVVDGIPTKDIPRDLSLRKSLEGKSAEELLVQLESLDSFRAASLNASDRKNPRRLVRAIEITQWQQENRSWLPPEHEVPETLFIGLTAPSQILYQRIDQRIEDWVRQGAEAEIKKLLATYHWESSVLNETLGYKEWRPYFEGKATLEEIIQQWKYNEHAYARRQMTWFKKALRQVSTPILRPRAQDRGGSTRGAQGHWFDITSQGWENKIEKLVSSWYTKT